MNIALFIILVVSAGIIGNYIEKLKDKIDDLESRIEELEDKE